ncbi:NUDIX domain-containing protein [Vagococcus salmoninarum]|nr:NUDIX domain-containing protein [Vagococcus salmoninarum]
MSTIVLNPQKNKILLIKQGGRQQFVLVAGYVTLGEAVETTVRREVLEEVGLKVTEERFLRSSYYEKTNTLMLNFESVVSSEELTIKVNEVDEAQWFTFSEAKAQIIPNSLAECFLLNFLKDLETN